MKGMCAHFGTIGCDREMTGHPIYFVAIVLCVPIEYHETLPITGGIVRSLNKW